MNLLSIPDMGTDKKIQTFKLNMCRRGRVWVGGAQWGHTGGWKILAIYIFSSIVWCCTTPVERNLAFDQK